MTVLQATTAAMTRAMADDSAVIVMGEDVGVAGGIFRTTQGLQQQFGEDRVIDTPLDEKGILAHAIGMALYGLRPIAEIQFSGFIHDAFEQIMFCGSKYRWITGGQYTCPMVVRRHQGRVLALAEPRGLLHPRRRNEGGLPSHTRRCVPAAVGRYS